MIRLYPLPLDGLGHEIKMAISTDDGVSAILEHYSLAEFIKRVTTAYAYMGDMDYAVMDRITLELGDYDQSTISKMEDLIISMEKYLWDLCEVNNISPNEELHFANIRYYHNNSVIRCVLMVEG